MTKHKPKDNQKALLVKKIADKYHVTTAYVYMVIDGQRENEDILGDYMDLSEGLDTFFHEALITEVEKIAPFKN